jgi:hypothetical protein
MTKLKTILVASPRVVGTSSFTTVIIRAGCSCGSPTSGSQVFYSVVGDDCCNDVDPDSKEIEFYYKPTSKLGVYEITAIVNISSQDAMTQCCPRDA